MEGTCAPPFPTSAHGERRGQGARGSALGIAEADDTCGDERLDDLALDLEGEFAGCAGEVIVGHHLREHGLGVGVGEDAADGAFSARDVQARATGSEDARALKAALLDLGGEAALTLSKSLGRQLKAREGRIVQGLCLAGRHDSAAGARIYLVRNA